MVKPATIKHPANATIVGDPNFNVILTFGDLVVQVGGAKAVLLAILFVLIISVCSLAFYQWLHGIGIFRRKGKRKVPKRDSNEGERGVRPYTGDHFPGQYFASEC